MTGTSPEPSAFRAGAIVPSYRHVAKLGGIVARLRAMGLPVLVVDDGNAAEDAAVIAELAGEGVEVLVRAANGGKGAAVKDGLRAAAARGWTHAMQVDADGQHDLEAASVMLELARTSPGSVICGVPVYDASIPKSRKVGREITHFWVRVETLSNEISDSMCGFRIYPVAETAGVIGREWIGDRMDFDTEILVQLNWRGLRVIETPVQVTYPEGNVSNFRMLADNVRISLMHTRLALQAPVRVPVRMWRRARKSGR